MTKSLVCRDIIRFIFHAIAIVYYRHTVVKKTNYIDPSEDKFMTKKFSLP